MVSESHTVLIYDRCLIAMVAMRHFEVVKILCVCGVCVFCVISKHHDRLSQNVSSLHPLCTSS